MLLRRVIEHVKAQNWTAVALDFVIVVVGVLLAIQINNWNEDQKAKALERDYLFRLTSDMKATVEMISAQADLYDTFMVASADLVDAAHNASISDAALIEAAEAFFSDGWSAVAFEPVDATFYDLSASGNLQLIRNAELRNALIALHDRYDFVAHGVRINNDWMAPMDTRIAYEHEVMRLSPVTKELYPDWNESEKALALRAYKTEMGRLAAGYHFVHRDASNRYKQLIEQTVEVLGLIEKELQ